MTPLLPPELADCARPWRGTRRLATLAALLVALSSVVLLALSGWFLAAAAIAGSSGPAAVRAFNYMVPSALIRLLAILRTAGRYFERLLSHRAALSTLAGVRTRMFAKAAAAEAQGVLRLSGGEAATLLGGDIDQLEDRLIRGPALAGALAAGLSAVAIASLAGFAPAFAVALCLGLAMAGTRLAAQRLLPARARDAAAALAELKVAITEHAAAAGEIAVYGLGERVSAALEAVAAAHDSALLRLARGEALVSAFVPAGAGIASGLAVASASGGVPLAAMAALAAAAAGEGLAALTRSEVRNPAIDVALERLRALAAIDPTPPLALPAPAPAIEIEAGGQVHGLAPGARLALLGRSGTGKTRLLETLAGLRGDAPQRVRVDGAPAAALGLYRLRQSFALVPQDPMLIAGTILDNLRIARPGLTMEEMWHALHIACLDDEVRRLPDGLDQWIGDAGVQLSGGQRKRLALARGLLAARPWLLLDEPSEGLDAATERRVASLLAEWLAETGTGLLLVTHRPALLPLCDRTLRLDAG